MSNSQSGYYFLQVPGPTVVPEEVMAAMSQPLMDHRPWGKGRGAVPVKIQPCSESR